MHLRGKNALIIFASIFVLATVFVSPVKASVTNGTIDATNKWAWGANIGWINFGATNGGVQITDSALTGYVWNDLYGWIHLNPTNGGVTNNNEGTLAGYAWSENLGWINFSGVIINSSGVFTGQASGDNTGVINFDCTNCSVKTDWQHRSARPACNNSTDDDGDGRTDYPTDADCDSLNDNDENSQWNGGLIAPTGSGSTPSTPIETPTTTIATSTPAIATSTSPIIPPVTEESDILPIIKPTPIIQQPGSALFSDLFSGIKSLVLDITGPLFKNTILSPKFGELVSRLTHPAPFITNLFSEINSLALKATYPWAKKTLPVPKLEEFVSKISPIAMRGRWEYLPTKHINQFVMAPLPKEFLALETKFPKLKNVFQEVGVRRLNDISKLSGARISLPSLNETLGFSKQPSIIGGRTGQISSISIDKLSPDLKAKIPSDTVFVKTGGQLVDYKIALSLTDKGHAEQKISTISGKPLHLTIRPDKPVTRVRGFVVFRSLKPQAREEISAKDVIASLIFAEPALAYDEEQPVSTEEKLVLLEFEYTDPDGDGLYTADINAPVPAGEYEVITVMDYEDPDLGSRLVRLITVVDPEGYIYEKIGGKELRIPGAVATLYYFNPEAKQYEEWPADNFQQINPQITDVRGTYSFLVPGGDYYIKVTAPGYLPYEGKPFVVEDGGGVHLNIEMQTRLWWLKIFDWRTGLLIVVSLFLVYNFYRDRKRVKNNVK